MRSSIIISALVAVVVGFGGSVAVILAAASSAGANPAETASWIAMLCVSMMVTSGTLSIWHRMPIVTAWSTPGAALIAASSGLNIGEAVGAFILCAVLLLATAAIRPLGRLVGNIPAPIATAVLAGVLFPFVAKAVLDSSTLPELGLPMLAVFLLVRLWSPSWAVLAVLAGGVVLAIALGMNRPLPPLALSEFTWIDPVFDLQVMLGVGLPLYLVTMASQNLPGFATLTASGYTPPSRPILAVTGAASLLTAPFGAHTTSLAAITASICTGPDAHPDPEKRWLTGPVYAAGYGILAIAAASVVAAFDSFPPELITILAGAALAAPFVASASAALKAPDTAFAAALTFVVTASGVSFLGVASAFWGLALGITLLGVERLIRPTR
ncbi:MAG: benzoate/H(+) symporter BenE family transporter [Pseudomonadota bacterium]